MRRSKKKIDFFNLSFHRVVCLSCRGVLPKKDFRRLESSSFVFKRVKLVNVEAKAFALKGTCRLSTRDYVHSPFLLRILRNE
jgi:hypothetical protein